MGALLGLVRRDPHDDPSGRETVLTGLTLADTAARVISPPGETVAASERGRSTPMRLCSGQATAPGHEAV